VRTLCCWNDRSHWCQSLCLAKRTDIKTPHTIVKYVQNNVSNTGHCCIPARDILERLGVSFGSPYKVNEPFDTLVNTAWVVPSCWSVMYTLVAIIRIDGQSDRLEGLYKYPEGAYYITPWSWKGEIIESLRNVILDRK